MPEYSKYGSRDHYNVASSRLCPDEISADNDWLAKQLGYESLDDISCRCTKEHGDLLRQLCGPRALILFKIWKARNA